MTILRYIIFLKQLQPFLRRMTYDIWDNDGAFALRSKFTPNHIRKLNKFDHHGEIHRY